MEQEVKESYIKEEILRKLQGRTMTEAAKCSQEIRKILKVKFPKIKFKVTSHNFAGGNSVDVGWIDGPAQKEVSNEIGHYEYGHFNGMIDCYEYSNSRNDIPQVKYLSIQRKLSDKTIKKYAEKMKEEWGELKDISTENLGNSFTFNGQYVNWSQLVWKETYDINFEEPTNE